MLGSIGCVCFERVDIRIVASFIMPYSGTEMINYVRALLGKHLGGGHGKGSETVTGIPLLGHVYLSQMLGFPRYFLRMRHTFLSAGGLSQMLGFPRIDAENRFSRRLYRPSTISTEYREHVKDLSFVSTDFCRMVIVDNNPFSFLLQPVNRIRCIPFSAGQPRDDQLLEVLLPLLKQLSEQRDSKISSSLEEVPQIVNTAASCLNIDLSLSVQTSTLLFHSVESEMKYATEILEQAHMLNCNPCMTPIDTEKKLGPKGSPVTDPTLYLSLTGSLQYLTLTDLICHMQFNSYLFRSTTSQLIAYSDADWEGCLATRRSASGYCVFLGDNLLMWSFKHQDTLSRFSIEAEYSGVADAVAEISWICNLLRELHTSLFTKTLYVDIFTKGLPYPLFADFKSSLSVRKTPGPTTRAY
nr:haloacid dehalogenase-like hydrolase (HAD) superfamily protein [Tanacetum cinerariifolium]